MQLDQAIHLLNTTLLTSRQRELTAVEILVLEAIWQDIPYQQVSATTNYEYATIRNASSRLLKDLAAAVEKPVSKKNCKSILFELHSSKTSKIDLDAAPTEIQPFWGRTQEIDRIAAAIQTERAKIVAIIGGGGMGKTALAARAATTLGAEFDLVIWRSLRESPPLEMLLTEIIQFLSHYTEIDLPTTPQRQIQKLLQYLRKQRCLLILDNLESLMEQEALTGNYRSGYGIYGDLLYTLGTTQHQSSLILTSREVPPEILELAAPNAAVRSLFLQGLQEHAAPLLQSLGLTGQPEQLQELVNQYEGNPLYLRIIANTIIHSFDGNIAAFLAADRLLYSKMTNVLQTQFDRLTLTEKLVMYYLAVQREPVAAETIATQMRLPHFVTQLPQTLDSLQRRALIQSTYQQRYTLQNVVMEFMTANLLQTITAELQSNEFPFFLTSSPSIRPLHPPISARYSSV